MSLGRRLSDLVTWPPPRPGEPAAALSLTAEDGTWIRMPDFTGHLHVALAFIRDPGAEDTRAWLQALESVRPGLEEMEAILFGVSTWRTDRLRGLRDDLGLGFHLLFDPLAVDGRGYRASSRWRPVHKNTLLLVSKDGRVHWAERGHAAPQGLLRAAAALQGVDLSPAPTRSDVQNVDADAAVQLLEAEASTWLLLDVRTASEFEADHAPQAIHIPVDELPQRYQELGQTERILCVCQAGGRSAAAAEFLVSIGGTDIANVQGGMSGWTGPRVTGGEAQ